MRFDSVAVTCAPPSDIALLDSFVRSPLGVASGIMQSDDDVGKVAAASTHLVGMSFLRHGRPVRLRHPRAR